MIGHLSYTLKSFGRLHSPEILGAPFIDPSKIHTTLSYSRDDRVSVVFAKRRRQQK
jgi:hypothetical protein